MGQAAIDLPDPLSAGSVSSANTDDLLAQLAGDEIERLLAEADSAPPDGKPADTRAILDANPQTTPNAPSPAPKAPPQAASNDVSLLLEPTTSAGPASVSTVTNSKSNADLDAIFTQLDSGAPARVPEAQPKVEASTLDSEPSAADALADEMREDAATHSGGRSALASTSASSAPAASSHNEKAQAPSIVLRILSLASAPLDAYPDRVRDLIGWIAILTTVNSAAILAYVLVFRHH
jgi:hypothetical protein